MAQISLINYNDILEAQRFDAEYFKPEYLREVNELEKFNTIEICDFAFVTDGQHGYHEVDMQSNIAHLTARHMKNWFANKYGADMLAKWVDDKNKRSSLEENDVILSTRGSVGYAALVTKDVLPANIDQDVARIKLNANVEILPCYLLVYLNSYFGQNWIRKNSTGMVQQGLSLMKVRKIPIPVLSKNFQTQIKNMVQLAHQKLIDLKKLYKEAEHLLLEELELTYYKSEHKLTFESTSKKVYEACRFDAEYFQPKYEEIIEHIENYHNGFDSVNNIIEFNNINYKSDENKEYRYIALSDISSKGYIESYDEKLGKELPSRARRMVKTDDVIISSIEGSLSSCAIVEKEHNNYLCSTGFYVMRSEVFTPEVLLVLFKTDITQSLLKRGSNGTILAAITKDEIEQLKLPLIDSKIQTKITEKIQKNTQLRKESKHLLELAKKSVEIAIENGEDEAINLIDMYNKS